MENYGTRAIGEKKDLSLSSNEIKSFLHSYLIANGIDIRLL